jgi:DNA-formamidopyrimidine glycosylase
VQKERTGIPIPEGPELRHSRDQLRQLLVGKSIVRLLPTSVGRYRKQSPIGLIEINRDLPLVVESIDVKGKFMWWTLRGNRSVWYLWSTYGMSGQWSTNPSNHSSFIVEYNDADQFVTKDQQKLFFNDQRRFGTIKFVSEIELHKKKLASLGPDVLEDPPLSPEIYAERILLKPNRTISEALMDQSCLSGVGNYLKAEILYRSGVSPHRGVVDLSAEEIIELWAETISASRESYLDRGASIRTYKTVDDQKGKAQFFFRIYGLKECPLGHAVIREETKDGRTSWWCDHCQK